MKIIDHRIDLIKSLPPQTIGAEVGVWRGYFSIEILNNCPIKCLYMIDPWANQPREVYDDSITEENQEENLRQARHHTRGHPNRCKIIRGFSVEVAANNTEIPSLDWVFIDGNHGYDACKADHVAWSKRLKHGGVLMGHDYTTNSQSKLWNFGVVKAVDDFCREFGWEMTIKTNEDFASYQLEKK